MSDCRGTILRRNGPHNASQSHDNVVGWKVTCHPYEKFFNQQEKHCPVNTAADFNRNITQYTLVEKADGTMVSAWFRKHDTLANDGNGDGDSDGRWQISTGTAISADTTFLSLMKPLLDLSVAQTSSHLNKEFTYMFELCCEANRVITRYSQDRVFLIAAIHNATGAYESSQALDTLSTQLGAHVYRPRSFSALTLGLKSLNDTLAWVEQQASNAEFGVYPEGFVVFWNDHPLCKMKNRSYAAMHNFYAEVRVARSSKARCIHIHRTNTPTNELTLKIINRTCHTCEIWFWRDSSTRHSMM
jgi:hypothetical protein